MAGLAREHNRDKRIEKQIGCMSGFLQIFDRQQLLAGKRIHSTKRLLPSTAVGASPETSPETESSGESREFSRELEKAVPASSDDSQSSPAEKMNVRSKSPVLIHRLSFDGEENQRRSPSVVARLMGLEPLSSSDQKSSKTVVKPVLRRSVSESRVSRDLVHSKYIDNNNFQVKQPNQSQKQTVERFVRDDRSKSMECSRTSPWRSRSFFDSGDFFPERNQTTVTMHEDLEKRLKMRGMNQQSEDLSTLKQILEVLQLKGLLRSKSSHQNFVYDRNLHFNKSNIVLVKPSRSSSSKVDYHRSANDSRSTRRYVTEISPSGGLVDRSGRTPVRVRTSSSPNRIESNLKACNSITKTKPLNIEIQRRDDKSSGSLKNSPKRNGSVHQSSINRSTRNQKLTDSSAINSPKQKFIKNFVTEDELLIESSSISESIFSTPSTTDSERSKWEGCREGKSLLPNSSTTESPPSSATVLPSPVSVLDSGFDKDELLTPSQSIESKAVDFQHDKGICKLSPKKSTQHEEFTSDDPDFIYISEILRSSQHLNEDPNQSNVFSIIETTSNVAKRHRKLIFDVVVEIIERNKQLPPWKTPIEDSRPSVKQIWSEFQKVREIVKTGDGVLEVVSSVIEKDLVEIKGWRDYPIEKSEAILDIERMIFKDLVSEVIRDLVEFSGECMLLRTRRKLVF